MRAALHIGQNDQGPHAIAPRASVQEHVFWLDVTVCPARGVQVGERALETQGVGGTVVWRNATAVFVLNGKTDSVLGFYEHFGL